MSLQDISNWLSVVGKVRLVLRLVSFWSGTWYRKLIFLKITFKEHCIYFKNVIWLYIHSGTPLARPPTGRYSIGHVSGSTGRVTLTFLKVSCIKVITSFVELFPTLKIIQLCLACCHSQAYHIFVFEKRDASEQRALSEKCGSYTLLGVCSYIGFLQLGHQEKLKYNVFY